MNEEVCTVGNWTSEQLMLRIESMLLSLRLTYFRWFQFIMNIKDITEKLKAKLRQLIISTNTVMLN